MRSNHRRRSKLVRARRLRPLSSSMHRVVLGAYQRCALGLGASRGSGLNAHLLVPGAYQLRRLRHRIPRPSVSIHRVVLGAYRQPPLQAAPQRRLLYGSRHRRFTHPDSPVSTASIRPHSCVILPLNGHAPPIAPTPSLAPTFDGLKPKSPPLSELSQCPRVHSRLTAKPKQMRALKTPTSRSRVRVSGAGDSRGARATAVADAMAHRSKSQP